MNELNGGRVSAGVSTAAGMGVGVPGMGVERWRLDECLRCFSFHFPTCIITDNLPSRFATELAGRKARRRDWAGLADEMTRAGWFDV